MRAPRFVLLLLLCLAVDLGNPFVGAAFTFDPAESIDGVHAHRDRSFVPGVLPPAADPVSPPRAEEPRVHAGVAVCLAPIGWVVDLRRAHAVGDDPASTIEDH